MIYIRHESIDLGERVAYCRGAYDDGAAFRVGIYEGGWRDTYASPTGIYWGAFVAFRNRRLWTRPPWRYRWWKMWAWMNEIIDA